MNKSIGTSLVMKGKKLRYGSASAAFTVAFVALIIIINVIFSTLASHYMWYIDMTQKEIFSLSEPAEAALENVEGEGQARRRSVDVLYPQHGAAS